MINLLPPTIKKDYIYAKRNTGIRKWILISLVSFMGLILITTYGLILFKTSAINDKKQISSLQHKLNAENIGKTNTQIQNFTNTFNLVSKVLGQEVLFSKLITAIGSAMPAGTALTGLSINNTSTGINLTAGATNYTTATQIQVNLSDPNRNLFKNVDIVSINNTGTSSTSNQYLFTVSLRALFNNTNQFLLINQGIK